jgi:hypothetical protein
MFRTRSPWLVLAALLGAPNIAHAEPKSREPLFSAAIEYVAPSSCPGADDFRAIVVSRLGFDPFVEDAPDHVLVSIEQGERDFNGSLVWRDETGRWVGDRAFPAHTSDCAELVRAMGFALAVQINLLAAGKPRDAIRDAGPEPEGAKRAQTEANSSPARPSVTPAARPAADADVPPGSPASTTGTPWVFALGAGGAVGVGMSPGVLALGRLFGRALRGPFSFELGGELSTLAVRYRADGAGYDQWLLLANAAACGGEGPLSLCLLVKGGVVNVAGRSIDVPASPSGKAFQTGLRFGVRERLAAQVFLEQRLEGLVNLTRWTVTLDQIPVWTAPPVAASLGLDLGVDF